MGINAEPRVIFVDDRRWNLGGPVASRPVSNGGSKAERRVPRSAAGFPHFIGRSATRRVCFPSFEENAATTAEANIHVPAASEGEATNRQADFQEEPSITLHEAQKLGELATVEQE